MPFTAFSSRRKNEHITAQLLVRRVKRLNPTPSTSSSAGADGAAHDSGEQGELIAAYRYDAVFTDNPLRLVQAEKAHRGHAIIEQVHADRRSGPLTHLPSGSFAASAPNTRIRIAAASCGMDMVMTPQRTSGTFTASGWPVSANPGHRTRPSHPSPRTRRRSRSGTNSSTRTPTPHVLATADGQEGPLLGQVHGDHHVLKILSRPPRWRVCRVKLDALDNA